jgi:hypothetical protein
MLRAAFRRLNWSIRWLRMTPTSVRHDIHAVEPWIRMLGIQPCDVTEILIFPAWHLAAVRLLNRDEAGRPQLTGAWFSFEPVVSRRWALRRVYVPPALEWCEWQPC